MTWIGTKGPDHGVADVIIDGEHRASVDLFAPVREFSVALYSTLVPAGVHEICVRVSGTKNARSRGFEVFIDAVDIIC